MPSSETETAGPNKRQRRTLGASDRVEVDVGGTTFVTAQSTLSASSSYFASLLSGDWDGRGGEADIFLDQDPAAFKVLLAYMRRGIIKVEEINVDVLALAEFLGMEKLLLAVKFRWYINIGKGPVLEGEDEVAAEFDRKYGGVLSAISSGLFPFFLKQDTAQAEMDYAFVHIMSDMDDNHWHVEVKEDQIVSRRCEGIVGALNGLSSMGYCLHSGSEVDHNYLNHSTITLSRRKHAAMAMNGRAATYALIPSDDEMKNIPNIKQYAIDIKDVFGHTYIIPGEFSDQSESDPFAQIYLGLDARDFAMEKNGFVELEEGLNEDDFFKLYMIYFCRGHDFTDYDPPDKLPLWTVYSRRC